MVKVKKTKEGHLDNSTNVLSWKKSSFKKLEAPTGYLNQVFPSVALTCWWKESFVERFMSRLLIQAAFYCN